MKNIAKIIAAGSVLLALAACSHVAKYTAEDFVAIGGSSYTVTESTASFVIPVTAYPTNGQSNTSVSFDVKNGSAVAGTDFTFTPANGVLTFNGEQTQNIVINIIGHTGEFTGDLKFSVELKEATDGYTLSRFYKANVTIKDEDHPLTALFGDYVLNGISFYDSDGYYPCTVPMTISPYEGDVTRVWINGWVAFNRQDWWAGYFKDSSVYAIVSEDMKTITVPVPQATPSAASAFGMADEFFTLYKWDPEAGGFIEDDDTIVFTLDEATGRYVTEDPYGFSTPSAVGDGMFYYDMNMFSEMSPTYFEKAE